MLWSRATGQCSAPILDQSSQGREVGIHTSMVVEWDQDGPGPELPLVVIKEFGRLFVSHGPDWRLIPVFGVATITTWDPDGVGPEPTALVLSSPAWPTEPDSLIGYRPDGSTFVIGPPPGGAGGLVSWDPDGNGLGTRLLVSLHATHGLYSLENGVWTSRAPAIGSDRLIIYDRDGSGPLPEVVIAIGLMDVPTPGGTARTGVAYLDGGTWRMLGDGLNNVVNDAVVWDRDGDGPIVPYLVAGGAFTASGANTTVKRLAKWNGVAWSPVSAGASANVSSVSTLPDYESERVRLLVRGGFATIGGVPAGGMASFDGTTWTGMGPVPYAERSDVCDGFVMGGPLGVLTRVFTNGARLDDGEWVYTDQERVPYFDVTSGLCAWDPDGDGPGRNRLVIASNEIGGSPWFEFRTWNEEEWFRLPFTLTFDQRPKAMTSFDPDGAGSATPWIVMAGAMEGDDWSGQPFSSIVVWDGVRLRTLAGGLSSGSTPSQTMVHLLGVWDPDGAGAMSPRLIAAGDFTRAGPLVVSNIAEWYEGAWHPMAGGVSGFVGRVEIWDPDGAGPLADHLIVSGRFTTKDGQSLTDLALWNGSEWTAFPGPPPPTTSALVVAVWDRDGDGPADAMPVSSQSNGTLHAWNGVEWHALTDLFRDPNWSGIGVRGLWDPDGAGEKPDVMFGVYETGVGVVGSYAQSVNGGLWSEASAGALIDGVVVFDPDSDGPAYPMLAAVGVFDWYHLDGGLWYPAANFARYVDGAPQFLEQPHQIESNILTRAIGLQAHAIGPGTFRYAWSKDGVPLQPGESAWGSVVHSVDQPLLVISNAGWRDEGVFTCMVSNDCGATESAGIELVVQFTSCAADYNADTAADILDFLDFLADFSVCQGLPAPCGETGDADLNSDTVVDILDFLTFLDAFASGCP